MLSRLFMGKHICHNKVNPNRRCGLIGEIIREKLNRQLSPQNIEIIDESHLHEGHAGARPGGETHFRVKITAAAFAGLSRIDRQRLVLECLAEELAGPVHALAMRCLSPDEAE